METSCAVFRGHLLYPQTEVEDAVRAVGRSVGPSHFFDEARQTEAQLSGVAVKDVFFHFNWIGCYGENEGKAQAVQIKQKINQEQGKKLTFLWLLVALLDPASPGFNPIQVVQFGGGRKCHGCATLQRTSPPPTLDSWWEKSFLWPN